mgnify:CR=1 FL=1
MRKGTKHSDETKEKIRERANQRGPLSPAHRSKVIRTLRFGSNAIGSKNPGWKGGTYEHEGYIMIRMPNHPKAYANGYVKRAVLVAEEKLGRSLGLDEITHHINGNRSDDSPENIGVMSAVAHNSITARERWVRGDFKKILPHLKEN